MSTNSYTKVQITLPSEDNKKPHELPFVIGVVADLFGNSKEIKRKSLFEREFITSNFDTFNQLIERINPRIFIEVDDLCSIKSGVKTSEILDVDLSFSSMEDFLPGSIIDRVPKLKTLYERMNVTNNILNSSDGMKECCDFLKGSWPVQHESQKKRFPPDYENPKLTLSHPTPFALMEAELEELLDVMGRTAYINYTSNYEKENGDIDFEHIVTNVLGQIIASSQILLEDQINKIIHVPEFKRLETSMLGLKKLFDTIKQNNRKKNVILRVLPASWTEITEDMQRAPIIERSHIFRKIFGELDMPGGIPFNFMVFDFEISHKISKESGVGFLETLDGLSQIASAAFCPFSFSALPELLGVATFDDFSPFIKLKDLFSLPDYLAWAEFRGCGLNSM